MDEFNTTGGDDTAFQIKKKRKKFDPLPIAFVILLALCIGLTVLLLNRTDPEKVVKHAAAQNYEAFINENRIYAELFDKELIETLLGGNYHTDGTIQAVNNNIYEKANGASLDFDVDMDSKNRELGAEFKGGLGGVGILGVQLYADTDTTTVYAPDILSESFSVENKNVMSQFQQLPLVGEYLDFIPEFDLNMFVVSDATDAAYKLKNSAWALWLLEKTGLVPSFKYKKADKVTAPDGNEYQSYTVTVPGKDAVNTAANFFGKLADMEEYKNAVSKNLDLFYSIPGASSEYGNKDEAKTKLDYRPSEIADTLRNINIDNVDISVTPVNNGILFAIDQNIGDYYIKLDGDYDRSGNILKTSVVIKGNGIDISAEYFDKCSETNGVIDEIRSLDLKSGDHNTTLSCSANYDKTSKDLTAAFSAEGPGGFACALNLDGSAEKNDDNVDITVDSLKYSDGSISMEFCGDISMGERTSSVKKISASKDIKISEIDYLTALSLYSEASDKLKSFKTIINMLT